MGTPLNTFCYIVKRFEKSNHICGTEKVLYTFFYKKKVYMKMRLKSRQNLKNIVRKSRGSISKI